MRWFHVWDSEKTVDCCVRAYTEMQAKRYVLDNMSKGYHYLHDEPVRRIRA